MIPHSTLILNLETAHDIAHNQSLIHRHADQACPKAITLAAVQLCPFSWRYRLPAESGGLTKRH